jgi:anti-sigma regulatory factor (Ser/Thr protein kinase)
MRSATHEIHLAVKAEAISPGVTRRAFAAHFALFSRLDDLLLCLSEVVTNAVLHGEPPIVIAGGIVDAAVRVEVRDGSTTSPVRRTADKFDLTGRGLALLEHMASDWGAEITAAGKTVWFEISPEGGQPIY